MHTYVNEEYWFYTIGINVISANTINKTPTEEWSEYQDKPIPPESFEQNKRNGVYKNGIAIIPGRVWRGPNKDKYLVFIDLDNQKAIDEVCSCFGAKDVEKLSQYIIVEQHRDNLSKAHLYFYSNHQFSKKSTDITKLGYKIKNNEIPAIEVKALGEHGIAYCSPSIHKDGQPYEIIGTKEPKTCGKKVEDLLFEIYKKYELNIDNNNNQKIPIRKLFEEDYVILEGHNRHEGLLRAMESLVSRNKEILSEEKIKKLAIEWNQEHCKPPIDEREFEKQWTSAINFIDRNNDNNNGKDGKNEEENPLEQQNVVSNILASIKERYTEIFTDQLNRFYVTVRINDHTECIPLEDNRFKNLVRKEYFDRERNILSDEKLDGIIKILESELMFKDDIIKKIELNLRVAKTKNDDVIYYDLTNQKWEIVKITANGWEIIKNSETPIFKRYENNSKAQVYPPSCCSSFVDKVDKDGKECFNQFLKLFSLNDAKDFLLLSVYVISLFIPEIPKVILVISGTGGGAKTTAFKMIKDIVDPSSADTFPFTKQMNDLIQTLDHHYVIYFDNISYISGEVSDLLCRAVTGAGNIKRALYTDDTDVIYKYKRCIGINGINLATTRADFLDRSLVIRKKRIDDSERRKEEEIDKELELIKPIVLGFIFDTLVKVLKYKENHKDEKILKNGFPRMADFAEWGEIISRCLGYKNDEFINAYYENINNQNDEVIESSPVAEALLLFVSEKIKESWDGTPTKLHKELTDIIDQTKPELKHSKLWPKASNKLTSKINEIEPNLKEKGIRISTGEKNSEGNRVIKIRKIPKENSDSDDNIKHLGEIGDGSLLFNPSIHRLGYSDTFDCERCPQKGDIHFMKQHLCKNKN